MRRITIIATAFLVLAVAACSTPIDERQRTIAEATVHCESEGKQFILRNVEQKASLTGLIITHWSREFALDLGTRAINLCPKRIRSPNCNSAESAKL
jgi:hypothetical protein